MNTRDFIYDLARSRSKRRRSTILFATYGIPLLLIALIFNEFINPAPGWRILNWSLAILVSILYALGIWISFYRSSKKYKQKFEAMVEEKKSEALTCQDSDELLTRLDNLVTFCVLAERYDLANQISILSLKCASELPKLPGDK